MAHGSAFHRTQTDGQQQHAADAAERHSLQRFLRWLELVRAARVALRRDELSARLDNALRRAAP